VTELDKGRAVGGLANRRGGPLHVFAERQRWENRSLEAELQGVADRPSEGHRSEQREGSPDPFQPNLTFTPMGG